LPNTKRAEKTNAQNILLRRNYNENEVIDSTGRNQTVVIIFHYIIGTNNTFSIINSTARSEIKNQMAEQPNSAEKLGQIFQPSFEVAWADYKLLNGSYRQFLFNLS